jgi:adenylate cyclase
MQTDPDDPPQSLGKPESTSPAAPVPDASPAVDLLARLRHDLRTPASHILGYAEMLLEQVTASKAARFAPDLRRIIEAGRRLVDLIRDELSPERLAARRIDLRHLHAELRTPLNHAIGYSELLLEQAGNEHATELVPDLEKIHHAAGQFLGLMERELTPETLRAATAAKPAVTSATHPDALALSRPATDLPEAGSAWLGRRVLVADDDPGHRELLVRRLHQQGFTVVEAVDGPHALRLLREQPFDLLLLDQLMPRVDGGQVLAQIKADPALRHIPVIMLSALDEMDSVVRCILMGAEDYLAKPFNTVLLRARIGACLEKSRMRRQEAAYLTALETEQQRSESLLLNVLPRPIADRLKRGETTIVDSLPAVTVLFADLAGFTALSAQISSVELVRLLDDIFSAFDVMAEAQGLEKIKTIGDAYMVVGGLPTPRPDHAQAVAEVALNMVEYIDRSFASFHPPLKIRVGINSGPVIAGIIGRHKFNYDLWGDTVNTASRMESHSLPGRIQVTAATYEALRKAYTFEPRGEIEVKGKGLMPTWFLVGRTV